MLAAASDAKKTATAPISAGVDARRDGTNASIGSTRSIMARILSVRTGPGAIAFTLTPPGPTSAAQHCVAQCRAALVAEYRATPDFPRIPLIDPMLMTTPPPRATIEG